MNTTRNAHSLQDYSAADALFDQIEQDLLALTTAPLDHSAEEPLQCVDEFADDFFSCWSLLPGTVPDTAPGGERTGQPGLPN
jgi:hypothetical protein